MGLFKDARNLKKQAKELQEQTGYKRPTLREGMHQASDAMAMAQETMAQQQQAAQLMATGLPGKATLTQYRDTGMTINDNPQVEMDLTVTIEGREPVQVSHSEMVPRLMISRLAPGATYAVKVDPADTTKLVIDWYQPA
jgi:hypothetical protein